MTLYIAYNCAFDATTGTTAGTSYTSGAKCAIQLAPPSTHDLLICEWSVSFSGSASGAPAMCTLVQAGTASTMSTAHSTSTIMAIGGQQRNSSLSMGTTTSGYGNGAITTNTTTRQYDTQQIGPMSQFIKQWPLGREPWVPASGLLQLRINTAATLTAVAYIVFEES